MIDKRVSLMLFLLVFLCYSYWGGQGGANAGSRMALIASIVEYHQLSIDPYENRIGNDKAFYNGHYYSDKAIGTSVLGVPVYAVYREASGVEPFSTARRELSNPLYPLTVAVVALPSAILSVLLYQLMRLLGGSRTWALLLSVFYSFGTLAFPFSTLFYGHQVAAAFAFAAFFALVKVRLHASASADSSSAWLLLAAGILASLAVLTEYQAVLIVALLFLYAATFVKPKRRLGLYILGGVPGAALLLAYNWFTLDSPFSLAYSYVSNPAFAEMKTGLFGITQPRWSSFADIMLGSRGLLRQSIFLWLLPLGIWQMSRTAQWRRECALCVCIGLAFITMNSAYYLPFGGGLTPGARFLVPSLPFLMVPLIFLTRLPRPYVMLTGSVLLLAGVWSVGLYFLISITDPLVGHSANPVPGYWLDRFTEEDLRVNLGTLVFGLRGIRSLVPLAVGLVMALAAALVFVRRSARAAR
jgi:Dolichyl-phosphate-mannose-protein mannosyltransferase